MIKACIFDLDGTLLYTLDSMATVANRVMVELGLTPQPVEKFKYFCGNGADMLVRRCLAEAGDPDLVHYEKARIEYRRLFDADPLYKVTYYPGMEKTLFELKKQGVKLAVCSNKPHEATGKVIHEMFGDLFDYAIGQSDSVRKKPAPDAPLKAAEMLGVLPEECLYFGDTGTDMQAGNAAGMFTAGVLWGYRDEKELMENHANTLLEKPEDILRLYEEKKNG